MLTVHDEQTIAMCFPIHRNVKALSALPCGCHMEYNPCDKIDIIYSEYVFSNELKNKIQKSQIWLFPCTAGVMVILIIGHWYASFLRFNGLMLWNYIAIPQWFCICLCTVVAVQIYWILNRPEYKSPYGHNKPHVNLISTMEIAMLLRYLYIDLNPRSLQLHKSLYSYIMYFTHEILLKSFSTSREKNCMLWECFLRYRRWGWGGFHRWFLDGPKTSVAASSKGPSALAKVTQRDLQYQHLHQKRWQLQLRQSSFLPWMPNRTT